jgi:hypothetical protein
MAAMEYLHCAGLAVEVIGGNLRLSPADRITDAVRVFVREHKPELLADALAQVVPMPELSKRLTGVELERYRADLSIVCTPAPAPAPAPANLWLARVARHLGVRPAELMQMGFLTDDDVSMYAGADPAEVAALIRSDLAWINRAEPSVYASQSPTVDERRDGEPQHLILTAATASPEWIAARNQWHNHLAPCQACYAPKSRYCLTGAELRQRYNSTAME